MALPIIGGITLAITSLIAGGYYSVKAAIEEHNETMDETLEILKSLRDVEGMPQDEVESLIEFYTDQKISEASSITPKDVIEHDAELQE